MKEIAHRKRTSVVAITREVRTLFHQMKALADAVHADIGPTASMRGVMETLAAGGAATVPQMARARPVSRQHIQLIVDELLAAKLVELRPNPAHKRSPLVALTPKGDATFRKMTGREVAFFDRIAGGLGEKELVTAVGVLGRIKTTLSTLLVEHAKESKHDR